MSNFTKPLDLYSKIDYFFKDFSLLKTALTHSSYTKVFYNYERLEFLGDSIIGLVVSEFLFLKFRDNKEGCLTQQKSIIVNKKNLSKISNKLDLIKYARIGNSINFSNKSTINRISADLYESLIGAIFLDSDYRTVKRVIYSTLLHENYSLKKINNKGLLIEFCSKKKIKEPIYYLVNELLNSNDNKIFNVKLEINNKYFFGTGSKLKEAEEDAAFKALDFFGI